MEKQENRTSSTETTNVSLPKVLVARVDAIFLGLGYTSRAEYIRAAMQRQLVSDEVRP